MDMMYYYVSNGLSLEETERLSKESGLNLEDIGALFFEEGEEWQKDQKNLCMYAQ